MSVVFKPEFWESEWNSFRQERSCYRTGKASPGEYWDRRAEDFASRVLGQGAEQRIKEVLDFLNIFGLIQPGFRVLDIGCGPGSFTIPFAHLDMEVVAMDPSAKMLDLLLHNLPRDLAGKVEVIPGLWEDMDIEARGWCNSFDLVFASMCPGIHDRATLDRMNLCSRNGCYVSSFSGPRCFKVYNEIFQALFGRPYPNHFNDIVFHFNLLYALGFRPHLRFISSRSMQSMHPDVFRLELEAAAGLDMINKNQELIDRIIARNSNEGRVAQEVISNVGMMIWRKSNPEF